jgi:hypothetical protein
MKVVMRPVINKQLKALNSLIMIDVKARRGQTNQMSGVII